MRRWSALLALWAYGMSAWAYAAPLWQWEAPGTAGFYTGEITLGETGTFELFRTPNLAGSLNAVSQPPVLLAMRSQEIEFTLAPAGQPILKKACDAPATLKVFASPVTVCDNGVANALQGVHVDAVDGGGSFTPRLWVYTNGEWKQVTGGACGTLEVKQYCQEF